MLIDNFEVPFFQRTSGSSDVTYLVLNAHPKQGDSTGLGKLSRLLLLMAHATTVALAPGRAGLVQSQGLLLCYISVLQPLQLSSTPNVKVGVIAHSLPLLRAPLILLFYCTQ